MGDDVTEALRRLGYAVGDDPGDGDKAKPGKRGRGRPPLALENLENIDSKVRGKGGEWQREKPPEDITRRHVLNLEYVGRANEALTTDGQGHHLGGPLYKAHSNWAQVVLTELGRYGDRAAIRQAATRLLEALDAGECSGRAQSQVALLRRWRLDKGPSDALELMLALDRTLEHFSDAHPEAQDLSIQIEAVGAVYERLQRRLAYLKRQKEEMSSEKGEE